MGRSGGRPRCFDESGEGAAALLSALGRCRQLQDRAGERRFKMGNWCPVVLFPRSCQDVDFSFCGQIAAAAWERLPEGAWPALRSHDGVPEEHLSRLRQICS